MPPKLSKIKILAIPRLLKKHSMADVARQYGVTENAIYYHVKKLRENGVEVVTRKRGRGSVVYPIARK